MTEPNPQTPAPALTDKEMNALIAKHRKQIDPVLALDPVTQEKTARQLGIDTVALETHYKDLVAKNEELNKLDTAADKKTAVTGFASFLAGLGGMAAISRNFKGSKLVRGFAIGLSGLGSALAGTFIGSRLFASKIREDSKQLAIEGRHALERELAVALENRERDAQSQKSAVAAGNVPRPKLLYHGTSQTITDGALKPFNFSHMRDDGQRPAAVYATENPKASFMYALLTDDALVTDGIGDRPYIVINKPQRQFDEEYKAKGGGVVYVFPSDQFRQSTQTTAGSGIGEWVSDKPIAFASAVATTKVASVSDAVAHGVDVYYVNEPRKGNAVKQMFETAMNQDGTHGIAVRTHLISRLLNDGTLSQAAAPAAEMSMPTSFITARDPSYATQAAADKARAGMGTQERA
jgi:hypothetical protein